MKLLCNYYVTLRCNAKCEFCNIWQNPNSHLAEQSIEEVASNLKALKKMGVKIIDFTGGEPLLYPHLVAALRLAKQYHFYTTITTNCSLYPQYATQLVGFIDLLFFSLHSTTADIHNTISGNQSSFHNVLFSIKKAKEVKQKISLLHTVTDQNLQALPNMIAFARKQQCSLRINPCFTYFGKPWLSHENATILEKYHNEPNVTVNLALLKLLAQGGNQSHAPICNAVKSVVVISPDNFLLLPCFHHAIKKIKIENNLFALQRCPEIKEMEKQVGKFSFCKNCNITCYLRASLFKKYPYLSLKSWLKSLREMARKQF